MLIKKRKKKYLLMENDSKTFWEACKPYFSSKGMHYTFS